MTADWFQSDLECSLPSCTYIHGVPGAGKTTFAADWVLSRISHPNEAAFVSFTRAAARAPMSRSKEFDSFDAPKYMKTINAISFSVMGLSTDMIRSVYDVAKMLKVSASIVSSVEYDISTGRELSHPAVYESMKILRRHQVYTHIGVIDDYISLMINGRIPPINVDYAVIDEAQDLTPMQWAWCFHSFKNVQETLVLGDVNQSIMKWAGACPAVLDHIDFDDTVVLNKSYRFFRYIWR